MTDERDPKVSQRYRELGAEEPPRALDDKILAASRRAVEARPAPLVVPTGRRRWYFPVAAAAVIMLAVAVTVQMERQGTDEEVVANAPVQAQKEAELLQAPATPQPPKVAPATRQSRQFTPEPPAAPHADEPPSELAKSNEATGLRERRERATVGIRGSSGVTNEIATTPAPAPAPAPVPAPAPAPAPQSADNLRDLRSDTAERKQKESEVPRENAGARAPAVSAPNRPAPAPEATARAAPAEPVPGAAGVMLGGSMAYGYATSPERWLEQVAELRKQGKHEEADKALAEFRKQYPDYRMSDEMRAKVERK